MRKNLILVLLFFQTICQGQIRENDKWVTTCKVWGMLKYYAPNSEHNKSSVDWDDEFLSAFQAINDCNDSITFNKIINNWITKAGNFEKQEPLEIGTNDFDNLNLAWLKHSFLSKQNIAYTNRLQYRTNKKNNLYFEFSKDGVPIFKEKENLLESDKIEPSKSILCLFRLWNVINIFYPYKQYLVKPWDNVLNDFIPVFNNKQSSHEYASHIKEVCHYLQDSHVSVRVPFDTAHKFVLPFIFKNYDNELFISKIIKNTESEKTLSVNDQLIKWNGIEVSKFRDSIKKFCSYSGEKNGDFAANIWLYNNNDLKNTYTVAREKDTFSLALKNITVKEWNKNVAFSKKLPKPYEIIKDSIGIIRFSYLEDKMIKTAMEYLRNSKAIILDITDYPNFGNLEKLLSYFVNKENISFATAVSDAQNPSIFRKKQELIKLPKPSYRYTGRIVVATSGSRTISYAETATMLILQNTNAIHIGEQPVGTNGNKVEVLLPANITASFSAVWIGYDSKKVYQGNAPIPNIFVAPTREDIIQNKDYILNFCIDFLTKTK